MPNAYYFGNEKTHNILVIDLLGPSLEDMFDMCERKFSIKTVAILAIQMVLKSIQLQDLITPSFFFSWYRSIWCNQFMRKGWFIETSNQIIFFWADQTQSMKTTSISLTLVWLNYTDALGQINIYLIERERIWQEQLVIWASIHISEEVKESYAS